MAPSLLSDFIFKALPSAALFGSSSPSVPSSLSDSEYKSSRSAAVAGSSSPPVLNKLSHAHIVTAFLPYSSLSSLSVPDFSSVSFISCAGSDSSFVSNIFSIAFISSSELAAGSRSAHSDSAANFDGCCCSSLWRSGCADGAAQWEEIEKEEGEEEDEEKRKSKKDFPPSPKLSWRP
eukprot:GHVT01048553.1.p2 GENE.GHVT01048553.1~~GHVT01048553.1.p2  ORF type:complete len:177 (+),score=36.40 GHVT01048553.1:68-598(+)